MINTRILSLIKNHYGLEQVAVTQKFHTNGRREAYLLETEAGRCVLKITDPNRPEEVVRSDVGILETVARFDFPAPRPLYTRDFKASFSDQMSFSSGAVSSPRTGSILRKWSWWLRTPYSRSDR